MNKLLKVSQKIWFTLKPWLKPAAFAAGTLIIVGFFAFTLFVAWVSRDLPDPNTLGTRNVPQTTKIFDKTGTHLLYEIHGDEKRTLLKIEDMPDEIKWATIAIEDKNFYEHHGIYWKGLFRALVMSVLKNQRIQGTSTLTQQLIKNAVLTNERSLDRKLREFILSLQIEQKFTKDQILQLYLNEIPYGSTIYGIESASQTYFGKPAKQLTLDEAALLASIPQRPTYYSPYAAIGHEDNLKNLVSRQRYVIDLMVEQGYITKEQASDAKGADTLKKILPRNVGDISAPHFVMYVRSLLEETYDVKTVGEGGLSVITTLDWDKQLIAEDEVRKGVDTRGKQYKFTNAALVSMDPKTGQIQAMVGSKDYFDKEIDGQVNVTLRSRQPGSSFKPIVYAAGFSRGYLPQTKLWDVVTTFKTETTNYTPHDYDLKERGPVSIRQALAGSLNIPAVKMLYLVGVGRALDFAVELGYTTLGDRSRFGLSLVLGGGEVTPLEHAAAFSSFATEGEYRAPVAILKVTDPAGKVLQEWKPSDPKRVMDVQVARLVNDVLSDNNSRAYIFGQNNSLTLPDRPVAAKTGTTNNYIDAWTAGFTPNLATVVWVGNSRGDEMKRGADGSIVAAPIWQGYMKRALKGVPVERFTPPTPPQTSKSALLGTAFEQMVRVNKLTGNRATDLTPPEFVEERLNRDAHDILWYVDKDDPAGPPPTNPANDPQFSNWESAVRAWVEKTSWNATNTVPNVFDDTFTEASRPIVTILSPSANDTLSSRQTVVRAQVNGPRPIARVEVYVDGTPVGSGDAQPWNINIRIPNRIDRGFRTLTVRAFDQLGLHGETSETINLTAEADPSLSGISILSPQNDAIWSRASFPKIIQASLEQPTLYSRVDATLVGPDGVRRLVGTQLLPQNPLFEVGLPAGPSAGRYSVLIEAERQGTGVKDEARLFITVTE